ncbi:MAG TPA: hypothetical protein VMT99_02745 [Candidatus Paceibacterota bacterium]|nr:hypothetical protein [Candidatus Paceibacterota bacterium]
MANRTLAFMFGVAALLIAAACGFFVSASRADAATGPQFLITWKANGSYVPPNYPGKALPTYGSRITASIELLRANGTLANLSGQTIYWYLNGTLLGGGVGAQTISFPPFGQAPGSMTLEVDLPNYNGSFLIHSITIPMAGPKAVIEAPYPNGQFSANPFVLAAIPYFFNTSSSDNLSYFWNINGQTGGNAENPMTAQVTLPKGTAAGTAISASVQVSNGGDSTQASASENLTYQPSL